MWAYSDGWGGSGGGQVTRKVRVGARSSVQVATMGANRSMVGCTHDPWYDSFYDIVRMAYPRTDTIGAESPCLWIGAYLPAGINGVAQQPTKQTHLTPFLDRFLTPPVVPPSLPFSLRPSASQTTKDQDDLGLKARASSTLALDPYCQGGRMGSRGLPG